jgi:hypothetical protein
MVGVHALRRFGLRHCRSRQHEGNNRGSANKPEFRHAFLLHRYGSMPTTVAQGTGKDSIFVSVYVRERLK